MTCIVTTTDLSSASRLAMAPAARLAAALTCELRVLHVVHHPVLLPALADTTDLDRHAAQSALAEICAGLRGPVAVHGDVRVAEDVVAAIETYAKSHGARFLVTAASGKTGWQHLRLGSVSEALVHRAKQPVVVVPSRGVAATAPAANAVAVATDLSEVAGRAVPVGLELARALRAPMILIGVHRGDQEGLARLRDDLARSAASLQSGGVKVTSVALAGQDVAATIAEWSAQHAAFVCVAPHQSGLRRLFFGSTVDAILHRLSVPGIVVPPAPGASGS